MMTSSPANPGDKYRLDAQAADRRREGVNVSNGEPWLEDNSARGTKTPIFGGFGGWWWVLAGLSVLAFIGLFAVTAIGSSFLSTGAVALIALVPLMAVTWILGTVDKWAPLGWGNKILGFLWGAGIAAGLAILVNTGLQLDLLHYSGNPDKAELIAAVVVAPVCEETFKGMGVILLLVLARHRLTSTLSAFAFAGLVGAGFAYTENIQYFVQAAGEGSGMLTRIIIARGVLSPFVHPMATSFIGWAAGSALLKRVGFFGWTWRLVLGFGVALLVHSGWNAMAAFGGAWWILLYLVVGMPAFATWLIGLVVWSRRLVRTVRSGLETYVAGNWISQAEVAMATDKHAFRYSKSWAKRIGSPAPKLVRQFVMNLRHLGLDQELMAKVGPSDLRVETDRRLLREVVAARGEFGYLEKTRGYAA